MIGFLSRMIGLVVVALCVTSVLRHPQMSATRLIVRTWLFLAAIKLALIWLPLLLPAAVIAQWVLSSLLLPELELMKNYYVPSAPLRAPLLMSGLSLISSGLAAVAVVLVTLAAKRALSKNGAVGAVLVGFVGLCLAAAPALAQSNSLNTTLPTKTVKVLPTSDVTIVASVRGDVITPNPTGVLPDLISSLNTSTACLTLLGEWTIGIGADLSSNADRQYADAFLLKNTANSPPPNTINPDAFEAGGDFRLFNRMQTTYRVKNGAVLPAPKFLGTPKFDIGLSINPCVHALTFNTFSTGEPNVANGSKGPNATNTGVYQLNEGRIGAYGQSVNETINGHSTPWIWSVVEFDTHGQLVIPANTQIFPTYFIYKDGQLVNVVNQSDLATFISLDETSVQATPVP